MPLGETFPRARVVRAIQALGLDPATTEQVILDPGAVRTIETITNEEGARIGATYFTSMVVDSPSEEEQA